MPIQRPDRHPQPAGVRACSRFALILLGFLAACATNPREPVIAEEIATARVENHAWTDMTVYVVAGGQRVRLGSVTGNTTRVFEIPSQVVGLGRSVTFLVDPLGSPRTSSSFEIYVRPGEEITVTIPAQAG